MGLYCSINYFLWYLLFFTTAYLRKMVILQQLQWRIGRATWLWCQIMKVWRRKSDQCFFICIPLLMRNPFHILWPDSDLCTTRDVIQCTKTKIVTFCSKSSIFFPISIDFYQTFSRIVFSVLFSCCFTILVRIWEPAEKFCTI